jgi:hypothetical protein
MKDCYFVAGLTAYIELSDEEFNLLFANAQHHYDYKVKSTTEPGGYLYGFKNRRLFASQAKNRDCNADFSESQLNLMMKALEMTTCEAGIKLRSRFLNIFRELQRQTVIVNKPLNNIEFVGHFI